MAMTAMVPAWTGSETTRSTASGTDPAMLRAMTGTPCSRSSRTAAVISPPMSEPASTRQRARGRSATARTAAAMFSSPTSAMVSTLMRSPRRLCRSASDTAPSATWATCAPPPTTITRFPNTPSRVRVGSCAWIAGTLASASDSAGASRPATSSSASAMSSATRGVERVRSVPPASAIAATMSARAAGASAKRRRMAVVVGSAIRRTVPPRRGAGSPRPMPRHRRSGSTRDGTGSPRPDATDGGWP